MKWIAIAGGWRKTNSQIEEDIKRVVRKIISRGDGIVSGGAQGVDYIATEEALKNGYGQDCLKIIIPSTLEIYKNHYLKRAKEGVLTYERTEKLITQLTEVKKRGCLEEGKDTIIENPAYFRRIEKIIYEADELIAFHINKTEGTQYTIDKAKEKGIPIKIFNYSL
ncbi:hypothetical protein A3B84_01395 [Candidatus Nomurabacteria bacterium RIFCSPHIGHO2_02_FULL_35_13]|uniref:Smf/DprA SLOG domain-containing protein n=1 Tax=Candidatus Nomurabacteria bacterium RIFCSPHIGHO2_02_FULL_35_13 TaxID=1801748 RepID=A0A1F6VNP6_9BACT|nr:MAG: hypothetical protein A3B84_01395 [Candidatus Nomurabacteria bacterium RIFCSPHIGHO2_02_FULL_35_13]